MDSNLRHHQKKHFGKKNAIKISKLHRGTTYLSMASWRHKLFLHIYRNVSYRVSRTYFDNYFIEKIPENVLRWIKQENDNLFVRD